MTGVSLFPRMDFAGTARFEVTRRLGAGGMGVVYEAVDLERGGAVALKTLTNLDARTLYRFKAEFRALADVAHPNLVRLGELFGDGSEWFFTMELIDGQDFLAWVCDAPGDPSAVADSGAVTAPVTRADDPSPPAPAPGAAPPRIADERRLRAALGQLAQGLAALHAVQKVHRDVKPTNVLVTRQGRVVLLDFGLATDVDRADSLDSGTSVVGTAVYMAPEQARSLVVGPEADWYAMGVILYEALTGRPPFAGPSLEILVKKQQYEPPPPRTLAPDAPRDLDQLCADLLRREPRDRPSSAAILERLGAGPPPAATAPWATNSSAGVAPPFVGRRAELSALATAFAEAERGRPISMFVLGESGMGKSALVRRFLDRGEEERNFEALILAGRCYERESVPFKAFDDVVDDLASHLARIDQSEAAAMLPPEVATLARVFPVLRRVPALACAPEVKVADQQDLRQRAFAALRAVLTALARSRPVVLFVDDFQWADADSLALFSAVMDGVEAPPLLFVATVRASPEDVAASRLPRSLASVQDVPGDLRILAVLGLPPEEARSLTTRLLGDATVGVGEVRKIVEEAAGHPMFIHELVRHVADAPGGEHEVRLDDALWARIGLVEPAARRLLEVLSVAGEPLSLRTAMQAAELDAGELQRVIGVLRVASLARTGGARGGDSVECYHDRVREAVVARLPADTLRDHHTGLANALEAAGAAHDGRSLVRHLEAAGLLERAAEQAIRAARSAADGLGFDQAAAMYEAALRLGGHTDAAARQLRIEMADALLDAGRGGDAADAYLAAAEGADAAVRLECRRKAAGQLLVTGNIERGLATLDGVLAEFGEHLPRTPRRALASLLWNRARLRLRGTRFRPRDESEISPRALALIDLYHSVGVGLSLVDTIRGADFQARGLRLALQVGERRRIARGVALDAGLLASQGPRSNALAMRRMARCAEIVAEVPDPYLRGWAIGGFAFAHYFGGGFRVAIERFEEAEPLLRHDTHGNIWELNSVRIFRLFALRYMGRWRELRDGYVEVMRDAVRRGDRYCQATLSCALNLVWLIADQPARAQRELEARSWNPPRGGYHMQQWYELRARCELALYQQNLDPAVDPIGDEYPALERSFLLRARTTRTEAHWLRGRVALARLAVGGPAALLDEAVAASRRIAREGIGYALVRARMLDAGIAARRGDLDAMRVHLAEVVTLGEAADQHMCVAAARMSLDDPRGEASMRAEGVTQPWRILAMLIPGLP